MVELGEDAGVATSALLTNMNVPLGLAIGNANEVRESVEVLAGGGPADVVELTVALAREMLALAGHARRRRRGRARRRPGHGHLARRDPRPGRRPGCARCPSRARRTSSPPTATACSSSSRRCRSASRAWRLGAGRARKEDPVQHAAGIDLHAKPGDTVRAGQPLFTLHADEPARFARALEAVEGAWRIGDAGRRRSHDGGPLIADRIGR